MGNLHPLGPGKKAYILPKEGKRGGRGKRHFLQGRGILSGKRIRRGKIRGRKAATNGWVGGRGGWWGGGGGGGWGGKGGRV